MKKDRKAVNMITDSPGRALLLFALPMILGNLFQQFYNIMDSVVVGRFVSEEAALPIPLPMSSLPLPSEVGSEARWSYPSFWERSSWGI